MKTQIRIQPLRAHLRTLALASAVGAAALFATATQARADLVGHWLSGEENLENASSTGSTHDGEAVGNIGGIGYSTDLPPGFTNPALRSLSLSNGAAVQIANTATSDGITYADTFDGGGGSSTITIAFWAKGFPGDWSPWIAKGGEGPSPGYGWQVRRMEGTGLVGFTVRGVSPEDNGWPGTGINANNSNWQHFAAVWDASTGARTVYVNGVFSHELIASSGTMIQSPGNHLIIGGRQTDYPDLSHFYTGNLFDVRIYNDALSEGEVSDLIPLAAPEGLVATSGDQSVSLSWAPVPLATGYKVSITPSLGGVEVTETVTEPNLIKSPLTNDVSYDFKVQATKNNESISGPYSAIVSATPGASSACDILSFEFYGLGFASISGTNITKYVTTTTDISSVLVYYSVSPFATGDATYPSPSVVDFTEEPGSPPQTFTVTAEDGTTTKTYTVTVIKKDPITYNFNDGLQGWTQIWPVTGTLPLWSEWNSGGLGSPEGADLDNTRFGRSPDFFLDGSGPLSFKLAGGQGNAASISGVVSIPKYAAGNGFAGVALRDVAANTYVLSKRRSGNGNSYENGSFTEAELADFANDGKRYTLDFIDSFTGGWGWTRLDDVSIPGDLATVTALAPEAKITSFNFPNEAIIDDLNGTITLPAVAYGSSVAAVPTTFTLSDGATCDMPNNSVQDFTSPITYTVTSAVTPDFQEATIKTYTVIAPVLPHPSTALVGQWVSGPEDLLNASTHNVGVHNGGAVGGGAIAFDPDVPAGFSGKSLNLPGNAGVQINNSATGDAGYLTTFDDQSRSQITVAFWAKGFPGNWSPWVAKGGENGSGWQVRRFDSSSFGSFTIRGIANEDHSGGTINVNNSDWQHFAAVWDQTTGVRSLYVNGVLSHSVTTMGGIMAMSANQHLILGGRQINGNLQNFFTGKLFDVRIYKQKLFAHEVQAIMAPPTSDTFTAWINANYSSLSDKTAGGDPDSDGMTNFEEFAFGLDPSSGTSANPVTVLPNKTTGIFHYTRLSTSGLTYTIKTSTDLVTWVTDAGATQTVDATTDDIQTMEVTLSPALLGETKLFVRVSAE